MVRNKIRIPTPLYRYDLRQVKEMRAEYPAFKSYRLNGRLYFSGYVQPSPTMLAYKIRIEYRDSKMPKVKVLSPPLHENRPHYYKVDNCLCLYKPENFYWTASSSISTHIVTWSVCWLYFYEVWLQTGTWFGPEASHNKNQLKKSK